MRGHMLKALHNRAKANIELHKTTIQNLLAPNSGRRRKLRLYLSRIIEVSCEFIQRWYEFFCESQEE